MGTPAFATRILEKLILNEYHVLGVISQPDKKTGRGQKIEETPTKMVATSYQVPVYQPENKKELLQTVTELKPDIIVVAAYGKIIPESVLDIPKYGTINVHGSLLPLHRGASCVAQAILNGERETGVTIMEVAKEMDAGNLISQAKLQIKPTDTTETLMGKLSALGATLLIETLPLWLKGEIVSQPQDEKLATYCSLIKKEDGFTVFSEPAEIIERKIRAFQPWPLITFCHNGKNYKIYRAEVVETKLNPGQKVIEGQNLIIGTKDKALSVEMIQPEGKSPMTIKDFLNGYGRYFG